MTSVASFYKDILKLVLSPSRGWDDISEHPITARLVIEKGFYPLLSIVGITAMLNGLYGDAPYSYGRQLQIAITQIVALFGSQMLATAIFEAVLPKVAGCPKDVNRFTLVCVYCMSLMALITIITNLCPIQLALFWFLPLLVAVVAWQAREFLGVNRFLQGQYVFFAVIVLVIMPIALAYILGLLIVR